MLANVMTGAFLRDKDPTPRARKAQKAIDFVGLSAKEHGGARLDYDRSAPARNGAGVGDAAAAATAR